MLATVADGVGAVSLLIAHSLPGFLLASVLFGASNIRTPARRIAESHALPDDLPAAKFFSYKSMLTNAGFAVGVVAGGLLIHLADPATYHRLLLAVAVTCLVLGLSYMLLPDAPRAAAPATDPRYRDALADPELARYLGFTLLVTFVSYGSLLTGLGALVAIDLGQSTRVVALDLVSTPLAVVALQRPVYALVNRLGTRPAIVLATAFLTAA